MRTPGIALAFVVVALLAYAPAASAAATVPQDFADQPIASLGAPTALAFTPDGRMLIATQAGNLRVLTDGALQPTPALALGSRVCSNSERGLLGVAVDPNFATNRFIYLFYTFNKFNNTCPTNSSTSPVNRVSRFTLSDTNTVDAASEVVLIDNMPSPAGNHNAGDVEFGKDGNLYVTIGDGGCDYAGGGCAGSNDAARDQHVLTGKVLRITPSGGIPIGNPFTGIDSSRCNVTGSTTAGRKCQETFAWGLRNPFRFAFDPNAAGTRFFINDVGQNAWEEIDDGQAGADYGWNVREGHCVNGSTTNCGPPPAGMTNPIFDYGRGDTCASITGGAFVPKGSWAAPYEGSYLFADYVCGRIFRLVPGAGGTYTRADFATNLGASSAVHLEFGPAGGGQGLYYTTYAGGGEVRRIVHTGAANTTPTASVSASPTSGPPPLNVTLDGSGSSDPDAGDTLTYLWDFGDGSQAAETSTPSTTHTYAAAGSYTATLRVRDNHGATSPPDTVRIDVGNTAPTPTISSPAAGQRFAVDETLTLSGSATDAQDGALPASALSWTVIRHHDTHTHPFFGPTSGNNLQIRGPAPEDLVATTNSYLEVRLTATDSAGLSSTVTRRVDPKLVSVTFKTKPSGLTLSLNSTSFLAPRTFTSWEGWDLAVSAPNQGSHVFSSWSDGGAATHTIRTPASARTYTATFRKAPRR
jgi:glucose/arabinose dehydrogenase/PKD repeat protein